MATITARQSSFIAALVLGRDTDGIALPEALDTLSTRDASNLIDALKRAPYRNARAAAPTADLTGMHRLGETIYKVQLAVHGNGRQYAKQLFVDSYGSARFEYAPGAIHRLSEATRMSLDEAREFGSLYGTCVVCGRTLTDEASIAAGIGPVCASRF